MRVQVEWLDKVTRTYEGVAEVSLSRDSNHLALLGPERPGDLRRPRIASIPLFNVREYRESS